MSKWKKIAHYQIADNNKLQNGLNRIGHYLITWVCLPILMYSHLFLSIIWIFEFTKSTFGSVIFRGIGLVIFTIISYTYYVPKGYKWYFYIVCAFPACIGVVSLISAIIYVLFKGMPLA